jgi:hypothetical protein
MYQNKFIIKILLYLTIFCVLEKNQEVNNKNIFLLKKYINVTKYINNNISCPQFYHAL